MREKEGYRDVLADILEYTNGRRLLTVAETARYLGIDRRTAAKRYDIPPEGIAAPVLARRLCG